MNIKVRFSLLFTLFVAIILAISSYSIYILYYSYREEDYYRRIRQESVSFYDALTTQNLSETVLGTLKEINYAHQNSLLTKQILIYNQDFKLIYKRSDSLPSQYTSNFLGKAKNRKELKFTQGVREGLLIYHPKTRQYVIVSGWDKFGLAKLANLQLILIAVFSGGLIITGFMSFFFVVQAFKPLKRLSSQIQETTEYNLNVVVEEGDGKDEIQQIAKSFNEMLLRLNSAFENQKHFVQQASHELRTPLATMLSQTESALNKKLTVEEHEMILKSLKEDQVEMIALTNSLLLLSQYEKTEFNLQWPICRIDELLYDTVAMSNKTFKDIVISIDFESIPIEEKQLSVRCNESLLKSAFNNIIKNAYHYSSNKTLRVHIEPIGNTYTALHFSNFGPQIKEEEIGKIMIPFFRGENANSVKGFGLGLSIVNRIVQLHKGKFIYTAQGKDQNKFTVQLPCA